MKTYNLFLNLRTITCLIILSVLGAGCYGPGNQPDPTRSSTQGLSLTSLDEPSLLPNTDPLTEGTINELKMGINMPMDHATTSTTQGLVVYTRESSELDPTMERQQDFHKIGISNEKENSLTVEQVEKLKISEIDASLELAMNLSKDSPIIARTLFGSLLDILQLLEKEEKLEKEKKSVGSKSIFHIYKPALTTLKDLFEKGSLKHFLDQQQTITVQDILTAIQSSINVDEEAIWQLARYATLVTQFQNQPVSDFNQIDFPYLQYLFHRLNMDVYKLLFNQKGHISPIDQIRDKKGRTLLSYICQLSDNDLALILEKQQNQNSNPPIDIDKEYKEKLTKYRLDYIYLLLTHGANILQADNQGKIPLTTYQDQENNTLLHLSIQYNFSEITKHILQKYPEAAGLIDARNKQDKTALVLAIENNDLTLAQSLIENYGAFLSNRSNCDQQALSQLDKNTDMYQYLEKRLADDENMACAIRDNNFPLIEKLIQQGYNVNLRNTYGQTPLFTAVKNNHLEIVQLLTEKGADVNKTDGYTDETPLFAAIKNNHVEIVQLLIEKGADVNKANYCGKAPLFTVAWGNCKVIKLLLENGADIDKTSDRSGSLFNTVIHDGQLEIVKLFIEKGVDVNKKNDYNGETPLFAAVKNDHVEIVQLLIEKGADVNKESTATHQTPLFAAAKNGHIEIIQLLIQHGADINKKNGEGMTPLCKASFENELKAIQFLLQHGADVNKANYRGWTPLYIAAEKGHLEAAQFLLQHGAEVDNVNKEGDTPLLIAASRGELQAAQFLLQHGAKVDQVNKEGNTPLLIAAKRARFEVIELLLKQGADINHKNKNSETALEIANEHGPMYPYSLVIWLLQKHTKK